MGGERAVAGISKNIEGNQFFANIVVEIIVKNVLFSHICRVSRADSEATGFVFFGCVWAENEPSPE